MPKWLKSTWDNAKVLLIIVAVFIIAYVTGPHYSWIDYLGLDVGNQVEGQGNRPSALMMAYYLIMSILVVLIISIPVYLVKRLWGKVEDYKFDKKKKRMWEKAQQSPADMFRFKAMYGEYDNERPPL